MDINLLREAMTVISFGAFVGIVAYAVHPANKDGFEEAANLPLEDEEDAPPPHPSPRGEGANVVRGFANLERNK